MKRRRFWIPAGLALMTVATVLGAYYVKSHPLVFNESLWSHAHCMAQAAGALETYARTHEGRFPYSSNGYGNALLLLKPELSGFYLLTGPGYDTSPFEEADAAGGRVDEARCGRVYVQGLSVSNNPGIAILFDKVAAPADHCNFPRRLWARFTRDVCFVDGHWETISAEKWPAFARQQVDLLVAAGLSRAQAQQLYDQAR